MDKNIAAKKFPILAIRANKTPYLDYEIPFLRKKGGVKRYHLLLLSLLIKS